MVEGKLKKQIAANEPALPETAPGSFELPPIGRLLKESWLLILAVGVVAMLTALTVTYVLGSTYRAKLDIMIVPKDDAAVTGNLVNPKQPFAQNISHILTSNALLDKLIDDLKLDRPQKRSPGLISAVRNSVKSMLGYTITFLKYGYVKKMSARETAFNELKSAIDAEVLEDSGVIELKVNWSEPRAAAIIANYLAREFVDYNAELVARENKKAADRISRESAAAGARLQKANSRLIKFKDEKNLGADLDPSSLSPGDQRRLSELQKETGAAENNYLFWQTYRQENGARAIVREEAFRVLGSAKAPTYPVKPIKVLYAAVGFFIGILAGLILAIIVEFKEKPALSEDDLIANG